MYSWRGHSTSLGLKMFGWDSESMPSNRKVPHQKATVKRTSLLKLEVKGVNKHEMY